MSINTELGEFLRSRRSRLSPVSAGIEPHGAVRRVAGLKREEVARLAGVSVDYYARLEQGRRVQFSQSVLNAVGRALHLSDVDQAHLNDLAQLRHGPRPRAGSQAVKVLPAYERIVSTVTTQPVFVTDWRHNVLAANALGLALYLNMGSDDPADRNFARFVFTDSSARGLFVDWGVTAALTVGALRRGLVRHSDDVQLLDLIDELRVVAEFDRLWVDYELSEISYSRKLYRHPMVGELWVVCDNMRIIGSEDQTLTMGSVEAGSESALAMRRLSQLLSPSLGFVTAD